MNEIDVRLRELRALLTETLPYELPLGFTNENLFLSELKYPVLPERQRLALEKMRKGNKIYTKPFAFKINRALRSRNTISIMHPSSQIKIAKFYSDFENSILQACDRSSFSLRFPASNLKIFQKASRSDVRKKWELGFPDQIMGERIAAKFSPSYFSYRKYLLLDRFFKSNELVRLESKFGSLRKLDISRCFFNIYTHSISWAQKEKDFAKEHSQKYSFEQQFDELMQKANYNETAGILVGAEVSRIFAEVIFQRIDVNIENSCAEKGYEEGRDYTIRRYVDDFYIFSNNADIQDRIQDIVEDVLEEYKLFLNPDKTEDHSRPFVTAISRVKHEVSKLCLELEGALGRELDVEANQGSFALRRGRNVIDDLRYLGGAERGAFVSSFSEVFTALSRIVFDLKKLCLSGELSEVEREDLLGRLRLIIRIAFYLLAVDFRVPPLIRASFLLRDVVDLLDRMPESERRAGRAYIAYELDQLIGANYDDVPGALALEITNVFILGLMVDPVAFCVQDKVRRLLDNIFTGINVGYFAVLCGLHYLTSVSSSDLEQAGVRGDESKREQFINFVGEKIRSEEFDVGLNCEDYLIFCDFVSCPGVDQTTRWELFNSKLGGKPLGKVEVEELSRWFRHTNWREGGDEFGLLIKRLQPVYFAG